jgi:aminoglycoside 2'-N-acetyltransferase I
MTRLRRAATGQLTGEELEALRRLLFEAFGGRFDERDWEHTLGGVHVLATDGGEVVAHGAVVPRRLVAGERALATGYVEGWRSGRTGGGWGWPRW